MKKLTRRGNYHADKFYKKHGKLNLAYDKTLSDLENMAEVTEEIYYPALDLDKQNFGYQYEN